jgi:hypothetical protein
MVERVTILENPLPTPRSKPWDMTLKREGDVCHVWVSGHNGSKKAWFRVQFADLLAGVKKLEGGEA